MLPHFTEGETEASLTLGTTVESVAEVLESRFTPGRAARFSKTKQNKKLANLKKH